MTCGILASDRARSLRNRRRRYWIWRRCWLVRWTTSLKLPVWSNRCGFWWFPLYRNAEYLQVRECQYHRNEGSIESPFHGKEEEEEVDIPGLEIVLASGCEGEPSTLEYVDTSILPVAPPPVLVHIPTARIFRCHPTPYPMDRIPLAF